MRILCCILFLTLSIEIFAQKKPLDHSVYDQWESIGERKISNNGKWVAYLRSVQEGDDELFVENVEGNNKIRVPRGYNVEFTRDSRFAVMLVKPFFAETREARIKKKKVEDMPKDTLVIITLETGSVEKHGGVRSYKLPEGAPGPIAYLLHKTVDTSRKQAADVDEGSELRILKPGAIVETVVKNVSEYEWNESGKMLVIEGRKSSAVPGSMNSVVIYRAIEDKLDTILRGGNDFGNFAVDS
ncbi:MAG TPA: hypothetical protein VLA58_03615, partial [Chitinophagaceae bacterium]|nr:hypothetical protein [Chitinophagaceae bacterium]